MKFCLYEYNHTEWTFDYVILRQGYIIKLDCTATKKSDGHSFTKTDSRQLFPKTTKKLRMLQIAPISQLKVQHFKHFCHKYIIFVLKYNPMMSLLQTKTKTISGLCFMTKTTLGTERDPLSQQSPDCSPQMTSSRYAPLSWNVPGEAFLFSHKVRRGPNEQLSYYGSLPECVLQNAFVSLLPPPLVCSDSKSPGLLIFLSSTAGPR